MQPHHWILKNGKPVRANFLTWAKWFEGKERIIKQEMVGRYFVSTVFLGIDHNFGTEGAPILWETMAFVMRGNKRDCSGEYMDRCSGNLEQAEAMHARMVEKINMEISCA